VGATELVTGSLTKDVTFAVITGWQLTEKTSKCLSQFFWKDQPSDFKIAEQEFLQSQPTKLASNWLIEKIIFAFIQKIDVVFCVISGASRGNTTNETHHFLLFADWGVSRYGVG
jgi:hypothetical protein